MHSFLFQLPVRNAKKYLTQMGEEGRHSLEQDLTKGMMVDNIRSFDHTMNKVKCVTEICYWELHQ
jgi:hypothetical protein